jgi:hypothetical protein
MTLTRWRLSLSIGVAACSAGDDRASDTDAADTDVAVDVVDVPPANQVLTVFHVGAEGEGVDFSGDGVPDNALAPLGLAVDAILAERLTSNVHVLVEQLGDVDDWSNDASIHVDLFPAVDLDDDGTDNTSGEEAFDATGFVDAAGVALAGADGAIVDGHYVVTIPADTFQVGSIVFDVATDIALEGDVTAAGQSGRVSLAVTTDAIESALTAESIDATVIGLITGLADLDLDEDGTLESVSMSFTFEASACALTAPTPP